MLAVAVEKQPRATLGSHARGARACSRYRVTSIAEVDRNQEQICGHSSCAGHWEKQGLKSRPDDSVFRKIDDLLSRQLDCHQNNPTTR